MKKFLNRLYTLIKKPKGHKDKVPYKFTIPEEKIEKAYEIKIKDRKPNKVYEGNYKDFNDELKVVPIIRYCGNRSKMYAVEYYNDNKKLDYEPCELKEEVEITKILNEYGMSDIEIEQVNIEDEIRLTPDEIITLMKAK